MNLYVALGVLVAAFLFFLGCLVLLLRPDHDEVDR